jgi:hypothetical protein
MVCALWDLVAATALRLKVYGSGIQPAADRMVGWRRVHHPPSAAQHAAYAALLAAALPTAGHCLACPRPRCAGALHGSLQP